MNIPDLKIKRVVSNQHKNKKLYRDLKRFLEDVSEDRLIEGFFLTEDLFQQIIGEIVLNHKVAKELSDKGIFIALKADRGQELGGILELAENIANG